MDQNLYWKIVGEESKLDYEILASRIRELTSIQKILFDCFSNRYRDLLISSGLNYFLPRIFGDIYSDEGISSSYTNVLFRGRNVYTDTVMAPEKLKLDDREWLGKSPENDFFSIGVEIGIVEDGEQLIKESIETIFGSVENYKKYQKKCLDFFWEPRQFDDFKLIDKLL